MFFFQNQFKALQTNKKTGFLNLLFEFNLNRYGGRHTVTMIPGDGIGPEMMNYVKEVFTIAGVPVDFEMINFDPLSENDNDLRQVDILLRFFSCFILLYLVAVENKGLVPLFFKSSETFSLVGVSNKQITKKKRLCLSGSFVSQEKRLRHQRKHRDH